MLCFIYYSWPFFAILLQFLESWCTNSLHFAQHFAQCLLSFSNILASFSCWDINGLSLPFVFTTSGGNTWTVSGTFASYIFDKCFLLVIMNALRSRSSCPFPCFNHTFKKWGQLHIVAIHYLPVSFHKYSGTFNYWIINTFASFYTIPCYSFLNLHYPLMHRPISINALLLPIQCYS